MPIALAAPVMVREGGPSSKRNGIGDYWIIRVRG